ncbi:hypothetical protein BKA70DRAFT_1229278 [Coprinopsis sp. MPI-PUGE-AT-0042]|nr:hypothetical protein BKA70DRAFT_1229278 [Coprinopsis sp. MPI-PUGE-AT-0042]
MLEKIQMMVRRRLRSAFIHRSNLLIQVTRMLSPIESREPYFPVVFKPQGQIPGSRNPSLLVFLLSCWPQSSSRLYLRLWIIVEGFNFSIYEGLSALVTNPLLYTASLGIFDAHSSDPLPGSYAQLLWGRVSKGGPAIPFSLTLFQRDEIGRELEDLIPLIPRNLSREIPQKEGAVPPSGGSITGRCSHRRHRAFVTDPSAP